MRTFVFEPLPLKTVVRNKKGEVTGEEEIACPLQGKAEISIPSYQERLKYIKQCNFKSNKSGEVQISGDDMDALSKMIEIAEKHTKTVQMIREEDGTQFNSFQDLSYDSEGCEVINQIAGAIIGGVKLGNGLRT